MIVINFNFYSLIFSLNILFQTLINIPVDVSNVILIINGLALMLMLSIVSIIYFVGKFTNNQQYLVFAKLELYQLVMTLLLLIFGLGVIFFFEQMMNLFTCGMTTNVTNVTPSCNPINLSINYIEVLLFDNTYGAVEKAYEIKKMGILYETISAFGQRVAYTGWGLKKGIEFPRALGTLGTAFTNGLYTSFTLFVPSLYLQRYILSVLDLIVFGMILPIGLILRTFPPLRQGGTFLIALAIGLKTIFVFTYVMHAVTVLQYMIPNAIRYEVINPTNTNQLQGTSSTQPSLEVPDTFFLRDILEVESRIKDPSKVSETLGPYYNEFQDGLSKFEQITNKIKDISLHLNIDYTWNDFTRPDAMLGIYGFLILMQRFFMRHHQTAPIVGILGNFVRGSLLAGSILIFMFSTLFFLYLPQTIFSISWLILQGIFLPALSFVITTTFINVLHRFLINLTT